MRHVVLIIGVLAIALAGCGREQSSAPRDVIIVTIDTLRADMLGYSGNSRVKTPFLDSLAARGVVFTQAHAHNVVTLPSHTNILTGLYPWQHGIRDNAGFVLDASKPTLAAMLREQGFATGAFVSAYPLDGKFGLTRGFDVYDDRYPAALQALDFAVQERPGAETFAAAQKWWAANEGKRRFLWVHLYEPHAPYIPPSPFREQYAREPYLGEVAATDSVLQNFLGPILEGAPETLTIITADHGESLGDHGELTHGLFAYEPTLHVPLIIVDPAHKAAVDKRFVGHVDIAPTIAERLDIPAHSDWKGRSLFAEGARSHTYFESLSASLNRGWAPLIGVISDGKKLIELPVPELYDLASDSAEKNNRFSEDRRTAFALRKLLANGAPVATTVNRSSVSAEDQSKLLALGYISGTSAKKDYTAADDPKNLVDLDNELHQAIAAYQRGDLNRALELTRKMVAARPDMQIAQEMLAFFLGQNDRPDEAIAVLQRNVAAGRGNEATRIRLGLMLSETGRAREAIEILQPLADRKDTDLLNAYGIALADCGDLQGALQQFQRVLSIDAENARAYQNLGIVALRARQPARARQYLERALSIDARLPLALNALGVVEAQSGNFNAAIDDWSRAVAIDPNLLDALYNLGLIAAREGRNDIARKALTDYLARASSAKFANERSRAQQVLKGLN
jgi:choline-sulfatase